MALDTFDFPYFLYETENPESGYRGSLGGSYIFTAPPDAPDARLFKLTFECMKFFTDTDGNLDTTTSPEINMKKFIDFYIDHKLYSSFNFDHPIHGTLEVKFNKPLVEPKGIKNGNGAVESFEIELIEVP